MIPQIICVVGPTATGKTKMGVALAHRFGGEVVSVDSMQIYRGMAIGTAAPTPEEMEGIPHHMVGVADPAESWSVARFVSEADVCVQDILRRGRRPILVGGTGLYITSLLSGMAFAPEKTDPAIRARLQAWADTEGGAALYAELQRIDPDYAAQVHPNNLPRVIRALELFEATGRRMSDQRREARPAEAPYHALCLCLTCRDRAVLYSRIDRRVDEMVENGVLDEARQVYDHRDAYRTAAQAIGYKEFFPYFEGTANLTECTERLKQATRNYAKRQLTWFRRQNDAVWLYLDEEDVTERACTLVRAFLHNEE